MGPLEEYSADTCWLARELRELGICVPATIPDEGWIPRSSVRFENFRVAEDPNDKTRALGGADAVFDQPSKWIEMDFTLTKEGVEFD